MANLLYLVHRMPYPPNKGDKVRSYHLLRHLAARHRVFVGTFIDDPEDEAHVETLRGLCAGLHVERLHAAARARGQPGRAADRRRAHAALLPQRRPAPLGGADGAAREHRCRGGVLVVDGAVRPGASATADAGGLRRRRLRQVGRVRAAPPLAAVVAVPARRRGGCWPASARWPRRRSAASSPPRRKPRCSASWRPNAPAASKPWTTASTPTTSAPTRRARRPSSAGEIPLVFTGAMDYWPNVDAVTWFAAEVLPRLREQRPQLRFHIVGRTPTAAVRALAADPGAGVVVSGTVPDVRPYLQHAAVVVAPLRLARGIQNKVLEAMAMGRPVVAASACVEALDGRARRRDPGRRQRRRIRALHRPAAAGPRPRRAPSARRPRARAAQLHLGRPPDRHRPAPGRAARRPRPTRRPSRTLNQEPCCMSAVLTPTVSAPRPGAPRCRCCALLLAAILLLYRDTGHGHGAASGDAPRPSRTACWCRRSACGWSGASAQRLAALTPPRAALGAAAAAGAWPWLWLLADLVVVNAAGAVCAGGAGGAGRAGGAGLRGRAGDPVPAAVPVLRGALRRIHAAHADAVDGRLHRRWRCSSPASRCTAKACSSSSRRAAGRWSRSAAACAT